MSDSSRILEHLQTLPEGAEFSRMSIIRALPDASEGAISGFLSKAKASGAIELVRREAAHNGRRALEHYQVADLSLITTRNAKSLGGKIGRQIDGKTKRHRLSELLLSIAEELETMPCSLADYSTKELLKELQRRADS